MLFKSLNIDITPQNSGCKVESNLEINAFVLKTQSNHVFFFSIDTLFIHNDLIEITAKLLHKYFGYKISSTDIWITATHTHFAPPLEPNRAQLGERDWDYFNFLVLKMEELISELKSVKYAEVEMKLGKGVTNNVSINRRRKVRTFKNVCSKFISMEMNEKGYKNEELFILKIYEKKTKKMLSLIWNYACHPTNLYDKSLISSEFPGRIRQFIRDTREEDIPVIFLQGFAGNIRAFPPRRTSPFFTIRKLLHLSYPTRYYRFQGEEEYLQWINIFINDFNRVLESPEKILLFESISTKLIRKDINTLLGINVEGIDSLNFRKLNLGKELSIIGISAEVVAEYSLLLRKKIKENNCLFIGYIDANFGYLPTDKIITEGGYEATGYFNNFLVKGNFLPGMEGKIGKCVKELYSTTQKKV